MKKEISVIVIIVSVVILLFFGLQRNAQYSPISERSLGNLSDEEIISRAGSLMGTGSNEGRNVLWGGHSNCPSSAACEKFISILNSECRFLSRACSDCGGDGSSDGDVCDRDIEKFYFNFGEIRDVLNVCYSSNCYPEKRDHANYLECVNGCLSK